MGARVLITDDHPVVRQGLRMDLGLDPEVERVFEVEPFGTPHRLSQLELHPPTPCPDHGERVTRTGSCFLTSPNPLAWEAQEESLCPVCASLPALITELLVATPLVI
jgi:hypothetical protein